MYIKFFITNFISLIIVYLFILFYSFSELKEIKGARLPHLNSKKLVDAGFEFKYSVDDMFDDAIQCCKEKNYL